MPKPDASRPLLAHPFRPDGTWMPFGRLLLFPDRIERHVLGRVREVIPLHDVRDVRWNASDNDAANFTLTLADHRELSGRLRGAGLWKTKLQEMMGGPRRASRRMSKASAKPAA